MSRLFNIFESNCDKIIHKWEHYFPIYEKHFSKYRNRPLTLLEIGVAKGGSLQMWKKYFGPKATIVGIDINPECIFYEDQINIEIGDQGDPNFLASVILKFGIPDIVIDDGSHRQNDVLASFLSLYPRLKNDSVYFVEDLQVAYLESYGGGYKNQSSFVEFTKNLVDSLYKPYLKNQELLTLPFDFTNTTNSISFYDGCIVFDKKDQQTIRKARQIGHNLNLVDQEFYYEYDK
jgi:hypothetical protein